MSDTPQDAGAIDWIAYRFHEIDENEIFWLQKIKNDTNPPYRKLNESLAMDLRGKQMVEMPSSTKVYQKEY